MKCVNSPAAKREKNKKCHLRPRKTDVAFEDLLASSVGRAEDLGIKEQLFSEGKGEGDCVRSQAGLHPMNKRVNLPTGSGGGKKPSKC